MKINADKSTPTYLRSAVRGALRAARTLATVVKSSRLPLRIGTMVFLAFQLVACADSVTGVRRSMDRESVDNILPAVTDARRRVASGLVDVGVRQQMTLLLSNVELGLTSDDVDAVQKNLASLDALLSAYRSKSQTDRPEVSTVYTVMSAVSRIAAPASAAAYVE